MLPKLSGGISHQFLSLISEYSRSLLSKPSPLHPKSRLQPLLAGLLQSPSKYVNRILPVVPHLF